MTARGRTEPGLAAVGHRLQCADLRVTLLDRRLAVGKLVLLPANHVRQLLAAQLLQLVGADT